MAPITPRKTTIVLVHGAFHVPWHYESLVKALESAGWTVRFPTLPSVGSEDDDTTRDVAVVRREIEEVLREGQDVAVVMHSYGGIVGGEAVKGLAKKQSDGSESSPGVVKLVYMCAFAIPGGCSLQDLIPGGQPEPWWLPTPSGKAYTAGDSEFHFYNDFDDPDLVKSCQDHVRIQNRSAFQSKTSWEAYREISSTYLLTEKDNAMLPESQEKLIELGGFKEVFRIQAGHSPWLSKPEETLQAILAAIEGKR
ncbi:hypothetical protein ANO11243_025320 [Dothideomycetidae sp. 11243]|nr:hypothetical protein ANO11243_025320 [fungal sp. No.11243]